LKRVIEKRSSSIFLPNRRKRLNRPASVEVQDPTHRRQNSKLKKKNSIINLKFWEKR